MKLRHLVFEMKAMTNLNSVFKIRDITLPPNICLVKAMVFAVVVYGCKSWTIKNTEHRRIDAFFFLFSGFCHTLTWISHGFTCVPHPNPPYRLPLHPIPLGLSSVPALNIVSGIQPGLVICFTLDNIRVSMLFSQIIPTSPSPIESKSPDVLYICVPSVEHNPFKVTKNKSKQISPTFLIQKRTTDIKYLYLNQHYIVPSAS